MVAAFLIALREGLEASIIIALVLAYLRQLGRRDQFGAVWLGTGAAAATSLVAGVVAYILLGGLEGATEAMVEGSIMFVAVAVLTWMVFWMRAQARDIKKKLHTQVDRALATGSVLTLVSVAGVAVLREGIETVLFMLAAAVGTDPAAWLSGGILGLAGAVVLGYLIYLGGRRIDLRLFFQVTGAFIILFSAGMLARGIHEFQEVGLLPTYLEHLWDLRSVGLLSDSLLAAFLKGLFGWMPAPSLESVVFHVLYLALFGLLFFAGPSRPAPTRAEARATS